MTTLTGIPDQTLCRRERRARNLTVADVAAEAGIDRAALSRIERAREVPTEAVRQRIAAALGLDPAEVTNAP